MDSNFEVMVTVCDLGVTIDWDSRGVNVQSFALTGVKLVVQCNPKAFYTFYLELS